jgi:dTDP-4-amino-4,6-dideoxygalactose transaminase
MIIDFVDLKRQNRLHLNKFISALTRSVVRAEFSFGPTLEKFESAFAKYCGTKYCVGLNSGTDALEFLLQAHGISAGDEVVTAPNSYFSTAMVITKIGATPVFADVDPQTYNLDPLQVAKAITQKTRAIIPVHLCGQPANMDPIIDLAKQRNLVIIEDCCQAHGAKYKAKTVPVTGTGAFSFYPGKNLGAFGDAGAAVTNSARIARHIRLLRNDGSVNKYHHLLIGNKSRLDALQAAILLTKLKYLNRWNRLRRRHAQTYTQLLGAIPQITLPGEPNYAYGNYHLYMIQTLKRNQLQKYLSQRGIATVIHYPVPIHLQPAYKYLGYHRGDFPVTERLARHTLSLPMFPELTDREIRYIFSKIRQFLGGEQVR